MAFVDSLEASLIDRTDIHAFEDWWKCIQSLIRRAHVRGRDQMLDAHDFSPEGSSGRPFCRTVLATRLR